MLFTMRMPLFEEAGAGTGGGAGAGTGANNSGAATFDPAAFETKITTAINNGINGLAKELKGLAKILKEAKAAPAAGGEGGGEAEGEGSGAGAGTGEGAGTGAGAGEGTGTKPGTQAAAVENAEIRDLRKKLATVTANQKAAEDREKEKDAKIKENTRVAAINEAMGDLQFRDDASRKAFFRIVSPDVVYNDDGDLVANATDGTVLSVAAFIKDVSTTVEGLLKPNGTGGAGARGAKAGANGGPAEVQIEDLTPAKLAAMKPEERAIVNKQVGDALQAALAGKP